MRGKEDFLALILFLVHCILLSQAVISINNGGYVGIVVAIHKNVPEDEQLVSNIKELFTEASSYLNTTTKGQVYFKEIIVAVPSTWSSKPGYEVVQKNYFPTADIKVDHPNPYHENNPYTLQPGGCGEPGQYIHLTPTFVKELHTKTLEKYGNAERHLVHEWAHLRYGVFDEYGLPGDPNYPAFYQENDKIVPTSCKQGITGWIESSGGGPCSITIDGTVNEDCRFIPDLSNEDAKASVMYLPYIPSITGFCDHTDNQLHNALAPTKHNNLCHNQPTWTVINKHPDFSRRFKRSVGFTSTKPKFRIVQSQPGSEGRYVLVLDVSRSMSLYNRQPIKLLHRAATRFVEDVISEGSQLGIVSFSTNTTILHNLTQVNSATRIKLRNSLPVNNDLGDTAIGKGLEEGLKVLKSRGEAAEGGLIILITDGEENVEPYVSQVLPKLQQQKVTVNAIAFGNKATRKLEDLTKLTGGKGFFFADIQGNQPTNALDSAFMDSVTSQADLEFRPVQIADTIIRLFSSKTIKNITLDKELGKNTVFTFTSEDIKDINIILVSPSGKIYDVNSPEYTKDDRIKLRLEIKIPDAEAGQWMVAILWSKFIPGVASFSLTSEPNDPRIQPVRVRSWLSDVQLKYPSHAKVYAEIKKGYNAVIGATVKATIDRPMGSPVDVLLRDNGAGPDVTKNDGIYSGYFTQFNGNGRYAVVANVINDGNAKLRRGSPSSSLIPITKFKNPADKEKKNASAAFTRDEFVVTVKPQRPNKVDEEPIEVFERTSNAGALRLDNYSPNDIDIIPPGRVTDLVMVSSEQIDEQKLVTLRWTSPGDDLDVGNASFVDLRASCVVEDIIKRFHEVDNFNESLVMKGSLDPLPPGEEQEITVEVPNAIWNAKSNSTIDYTRIDVYFSLRIVDERNNLGDLSNIVVGHFKKIPFVLLEEEPSTEWRVYVFGIGAATLLIVVIVVTCRNKGKINRCTETSLTNSA
ncbi:calcium-activated chloride channel regulator 1-like isoform X1 [Tachypleus tridentatus]|uniref:calcium-activated chloride channel regulator 1-like isoform X1 n=1 Tax=Tachypleus tridentatus TaxID=6853 RepID=UPI003FD4CCF7